MIFYAHNSIIIYNAVYTPEYMFVQRGRKLYYTETGGRNAYWFYHDVPNSLSGEARDNDCIIYLSYPHKS